MKSAIRLLVLSGIVLTMGQAATRSDINTIEAAENIRYLSQKIAKNYLYLYSRPQHTEIKGKILTMIEEVSHSFDTISSSTDDTNTKDILKYLVYNKNGMEELLDQNVSKSSSMKMLDYSEILLEGGKSIAKTHSYQFNSEEKMLMDVKRNEYLIERLGKFYMASSLGALSQTNRQKMDESRLALKEGLKKIQQYSYPKKLEKEKKQLNYFWNANMYLLSHSYDMFVPNLMEISSTYMENMLADFAIYHSKKQ